MSSDPASTVDAEVGSGTAGGAIELSLVWLTGEQGNVSLSLDWHGAAELIIGRDDDCGVRLSGNDVSRRHAALRRAEDGAALSVLDLGSRNGTRVNGRAVQSALLRANDVLRVGGCVLIVVDSRAGFADIAPGLAGGGTLQRVLLPLARAARSDLPIVLEGETGTGKELVASAVHLWSARSGALVAVNCAALPEGLAEAELFGYRRGAFTGADRASEGFVRSANGGTLLLDEVTDLPLVVQAKLLRALEQKEVQPLGETRPVPVDVRVIVAGQQSLLEAVQKQQFRADLLARLSGFSVRLPALRERRDDVLPLLLRFLVQLCPGFTPRLEPDFCERLALHDWPFNVRELLLLARRLAVFHGEESVLRGQHLPPGMGDGAREPSAPAAVAPPGLALSAEAEVDAESIDLEKLLRALRDARGNVTRAATKLGITRQRAYRLMEGHVDLATLGGKP
ncbi:MAG: sigma 54-interacting transcriptional regulator, partial [Polyangiaceae bacterium]